MEAMEAETSKLKQSLIESIGEANTLTEKVKVKALSDDLRAECQLTLEKDEQLLGVRESLKTIAARSVEAFQTTDEYNSVLFSWYFKGFELLRQYLVKHPSGVDMAKLDLEEVEQEMAADEANHSATETDAPETAPASDAPEGVSADDARTEEDAVGDARAWPFGKKNQVFLPLSFFVDLGHRILADIKIFFFFSGRTIFWAQCLWAYKQLQWFPFGFKGF